MKLVVIEEKCPQNHICPAIKVCPTRAIKQKEFNAPSIDYNLCITCGKCSNFCPKGALQIRKEENK